ncbi:MAG: hypothetical protein JWP40_3939 [Blastococcus sp.]|nr:hypothetical protein [Blastococcus sp.]
MAARFLSSRVAVGRARVVREVRAAAPLMAALAAPVTARGPWLTAVLNDQAARGSTGPWAPRPVAVVVEAHREGRPEGVAFLSLRRRRLVTEVTLLGDGTAPVPGGRPPARLLARDEASAELLAAGIVDLVGALRGPWTLRLAGLPMGDPASRDLAAAQPTGVLANVRSRRLVDELDTVGDVRRSREPHELERWLPALLAREPDARARGFLRAAARLHAAIGQVELAVVADGDRLRAGLLTLVDGADRWPWWAFSEISGLRREMGAPLVGLTIPARGWPRAAALSRRRGAR